MSFSLHQSPALSSSSVLSLPSHLDAWLSSSSIIGQGEGGEEGEEREEKKNSFSLLLFSPAPVFFLSSCPGVHVPSFRSFLLSACCCGRPSEWALLSALHRKSRLRLPQEPLARRHLPLPAYEERYGAAPPRQGAATVRKKKKKNFKP